MDSERLPRGFAKGQRANVIINYLTLDSLRPDRIEDQRL